MNDIASMSGSQAVHYYGGTQPDSSSKAANGYITHSDSKTKTDQAENASVSRDSQITGSVIGEPKLSEKAAKYYEQLKNKFHNLDFVLVSEDQKANAQANAAQYANASRMVVLIDTDKIERMANDESYRKQYEGIISQAGNQLSQLSSSLTMQNSNVKSYGMKFDDGGNASFFAVIDQLNKEQDKRIAAKAAQKKQALKAENKKKAEKDAKVKAEEKAVEDRKSKTIEADTITITASSVEQLLQKIDNYNYGHMSDTTQSEQEKQIGQHIDFKG